MQAPAGRLIIMTTAHMPVQKRILHVLAGVSKQMEIPQRTVKPQQTVAGHAGDHACHYHAGPQLRVATQDSGAAADAHAGPRPVHDG